MTSLAYDRQDEPHHVKRTTDSTYLSSSSSSSSALLDDLLFDCEITDCALLPRTFWMPCINTKPRCTLEKCALEVFNHHVKNLKPNQHFDPSTSGAEWWVQIRPSPPAGRYNLLIQQKRSQASDKPTIKNSDNHNNNNNNDCDKNTTYDKNDDQIEQENGNDNINNTDNDDEFMERNGINFHWDKDEDLRLLMGGNMYIHPHISTVTYLTDIGAPTMALNYRINALTGEHIIPNENEDVEGYISWPKKGKHLSFDGRFLHAAPFDFMEKGLFEKQITILKQQKQQQQQNHGMTKQDDKHTKILQRRHRRVTFLVNIWLNYKPFNVETFPESMIDKLSKVDDSDEKTAHTLFKNDAESETKESEACFAKNHVIDFGCPSSPSSTGTETNTKSAETHQHSKYKHFEWSMGNSCEGNETISMSVPIELIQNEIGSNIKLSWACKTESERGIKLHRNTQEVNKQDNTLNPNTKKQRVN